MNTELIKHRIKTIRDLPVLLDRDLADLYGVTTKALKQAVRRNLDRFPSDFMFELTDDEMEHLRSQFVTSSQHGGTRIRETQQAERKKIGFRKLKE